MLTQIKPHVKLFLFLAAIGIEGVASVAIRMRAFVSLS